MIKRLAVAAWNLFVLLLLLALGVLLANVLMIMPPVRKGLNVPPDAPNLFAQWVDMSGDRRLAEIEHEIETAGMDATPSGHPSGSEAVSPSALPAASPSPSPTASATPFHRMSWEELEKGPPRNPAADPLSGRTVLLYFDQHKEMVLSSMLSRLPLPILRLGVVPSSGRHLAFVEFWCGNPPSRSAIEQTASGIIDIIFSNEPSVDEVDAIAVPWRTIRAAKPPTFFSVVAQRRAWADIKGWAPSQQLRDEYGAVWWDPRVQSGQ